MRKLTISLNLTAASLLLAAATACSSAGAIPSTLGMTPSAPQSAASQTAFDAHSHPAITSGTKLLYVADNTHNVILVFNQTNKTPKLKYKITSGINKPAGITTDLSGNLYVTNQFSGPSGGLGNLEIYKLGAKTPFETITTGMNGPMDVKVDNAGNIYVANEPNEGTTRPWINFYPAGVTEPSNTFYPPADSTPVLTGIALVDPSEGGNTPIIATDFTDNDGYFSGAVIQCAAQFGCSNLGYSFGQTGGLAVENPAGPYNALDFLAVDKNIPGFDNIVLDQKESQFSTGGVPQSLAFDSTRTHLFVSNTGDVDEYSWPKMKKINTYSGNLGKALDWGVAVNPAGTF